MFGLIGFYLMCMGVLVIVLGAAAFINELEIKEIAIIFFIFAVSLALILMGCYMIGG